MLGLLGTLASLAGNEAAIYFGRRVLISAAMIGSVALAGALALFGAQSYLLAVALMLAYGVVIWLDSSSLTAGTAGTAEPARRGATLAVHSSLGYFGGFIGPLAVGWVLDFGGGNTGRRMGERVRHDRRNHARGPCPVSGNATARPGGRPRRWILNLGSLATFCPVGIPSYLNGREGRLATAMPGNPAASEPRRDYRHAGVAALAFPVEGFHEARRITVRASNADTRSISFSRENRQPAEWSILLRRAGRFVRSCLSAAFGQRHVP